MSSDKRSTVVPESLHGMRLDQVAAELFPEYSRSRLSGWIKSGALTLDGDSVRPRDKVSVGSTLTLDAEPEVEVTWSREDQPLDIIHEDEHIIVLNKPAGVVVHPAAGNPDGTLVNGLLGYAPELEQLPRGGIVHRLDKDTSGIMFVARSPLAHKSLVAQLADRTVSREYCALCRGVLTGGGMVDAPIDRHPQARTKMAVVPNGKPAVTHYRIAARYGHHTQLTVNLETGRTHQIRVHMAYRKNPLIGDPVYGGRPQIPPGASPALTEALRGFPRQALHARTLTFEHPATEETVSFTTPLPEDLQAMIEVLETEDLVDG